jgi:hypothetical protein
MLHMRDIVMKWKIALVSAAAALGLSISMPIRAQPVTAETSPTAPDYALAGSWAAGLGGPGASAALPAGASPAAQNAGVDVFYVHPTTSSGAPGKWNLDIADAASNRWVDESVVARQAGVFSACCRIFAPRYRAATFAAFGNPAVRKAAFGLAYSDVERAFDWYLAHENKGRPFIIAGHSQGAFHIATLLEQRIDGKPLQKQMVGAWIIGINLAEGDFGRRFHHVTLCDKPAQTGCVLQWNALLAGADVAKAAARASQGYVDKYGDEPGKVTACINPLTFNRSSPGGLSADARGAVPGSPGFGEPKALRKGAVAARCDSGMLVVYPAPGLDLAPLGGGVMHYHDYGLFYEDIRENAVLRARAFLKSHAVKR